MFPARMTTEKFHATPLEDDKIWQYTIVEHQGFIRFIAQDYPRDNKDIGALSKYIILAAWVRDNWRILLDTRSFPPKVNSELLLELLATLNLPHYLAMGLKIAMLTPDTRLLDVNNLKTDNLSHRSFTNEAMAQAWLLGKTGNQGAPSVTPARL
ncbi:hypothetical protein GM415_01855 [Pseudodesulfovibrio cashew]|uniref:Uncharacterized protein n=1 Tax=Pseudodesulfovibrio cashew TaxID=2678688 RepID=A0A6I6JA53_9BACT|nr:hypothetical protein [Pseudodesulfovibrio cashew]QGY38931.1 hypothetical protein GM415_01855 [Pseudodesulfovibrio cashew]